MQEQTASSACILLSGWGVDINSLCICSAQSKNRYDSGIVLAQSRNPTLSADSGIVPDNSRIAQGIYIVLSSDIICAQSRNRVGQSKNLIGSAK